MKPHRLSLTHSLVLNYGLYQKMEVGFTSIYGSQQRHVDKDGHPNKQTTSILMKVHKLSGLYVKSSDFI